MDFGLGALIGTGASLLGNALGLGGSKQSTTQSVGPLTPEGQQLWDMAMGQLQKTAPTRQINFGGNNWTVQNKGYNNLLQALMNIDNARRGATQTSQNQSSMFGSLLPIMGLMAGTENQATNNNNGMGLSGAGGWGLGNLLSGGLDALLGRG